MNIQAIYPKTVYSINRNRRDDNDYGSILTSYDISFKECEHYLQIGSPSTRHGWIIHISILPFQLESFIHDASSLFREIGVSLRLVKCFDLAKLVSDGNFGYEKLGKQITFYPSTAEEANRVVKEVEPFTKKFKGPRILTDVCVTGIIYARYSSLDSSDLRGKLNIPFVYPKGVPWPFENYAMPSSMGKRTLLNQKYRITNTLKSDIKGNVFKGLYLNRLFPTKCIIKEGKHQMWADEFGRDIKDRLIWQQHQHNRLNELVLVPNILDVFEEDGSFYLVMEYISGISLQAFLLTEYQGQNWKDLSRESRGKIIQYILRVIDIIETLHINGIVHRDITPVNFIIRKDGKIVLIDLELSYDLKVGDEVPPFDLGTFGFMSPEQLGRFLPTEKEDIYGLGALMVAAFTGLHPYKLSDQDSLSLAKKLSYFIHDKKIVDLIVRCLDQSSVNRPSLRDIRTHVKEFGDSERIFANIKRLYTAVDKNFIHECIQTAIDGLVDPFQLSPSGIWFSQSALSHLDYGTKQISKGYQVGFESGISGILYFIGLAQRDGFNLEKCKNPYEESLDYLFNRISTTSQIDSGGLYFESYGLSLAFGSAVSIGFLRNSNEIISLIERCLNASCERLDICSGISGKLIALIQLRDIVSKPFFKEIAFQCREQLIRSQDKAGFWNVTPNGGRANQIYTGFSTGVSGIVYSLLLLLEIYPDDREIRACIEKGLIWLGSRMQRKGFWEQITNTNTRDMWTYHFGSVGYATVLLKAYQVLKWDNFRVEIDGILRNIPAEPIQVNFTYLFGLAGLGDVYLEAFKILQDEEWLQRSNWLAGLFSNTLCKTSVGGMWSLDEHNNSEAALLTGNTGVIYYLIRHLHEPNTGSMLLDRKFPIPLDSLH